MKIILIALALAITARCQVTGQTAVSGETATFTFKVKKATPLTATATCACQSPACSVDPSDGSFVAIPGPLSCTVSLNKAVPNGATISLASATPTTVSVPPTVVVGACTAAPCAVQFMVTILP